MDTTAVFSEEEMKQMEELRQRIEGWDTSHFSKEFLEKHMYTDDSSMWRFLRAREFKLDKAEEMFKFALTWKDSIGIDALLEEFRGNRSEKAAIKRAISDRAKQAEALFGGGILDNVRSVHGAPVVVERMGKVDFAGLSKAHDMVELYKLAYTVYLEENWRAVRALGGKQQALMVIDMKGLGISAVRHVGLVKNIAKIGPQSYAEIFKTVVILNAPSIITHFWRFIGPILPAHTKDKVKIPTKSHAMALLDELIEGGRSNLPTFLGGEHNGETICPAEPVSVVQELDKTKANK